MIALKTLRRDLGALLATGVGGAHAPLGAQINPPAVTVTGSTSYVTAQDYCTDLITFDATIVAPAGDLAAVADALDAMIDQVRATLRGTRYQFQGVSGYTTVADDLPAAVATIATVRNND